jgi:serine/threonine-protein kinase
MPRRDDAPCDLLFGLLALQNGMVTRDQLVAAFGAWTAAPEKPLADLLAGQGALRPEHRPLLDALVGAHLKLHGNDPERSLAALELNRSTRESLAVVGGSEVQATLARVGSGSSSNDDADRTASYAVGTATSDGQRFRVLRPHARGGLGAVFVALDEELHREVALKQILEEHVDDPLSRQRFLLEAEVTGGLEHPGIVPVYGLGCFPDGRPFYAMRFIRGDSLKEAIERFHRADGPDRDPGERTLGQQRLLRRFIDVCNAVAYAHSRGILHRDLKPGNVMLGPYGETLVVDWGLAKPIGRAGGSAGTTERTLHPSSASGVTPTQMGAAVGTPQFMSPEQAAGRLDELGPASDVYSLGATLYGLLTGQAPFRDPEIGTVLRRIQAGDFPLPRQVKKDVPRALEAICLKAMALTPAERYDSPRSLADDLEHWLADEPVTAWREPPMTQTLRWARRHKTGVAGALAVLLTALVALTISTVLITRKQRETDDARRRAESSFRQAQAAVDRYLNEISENRLLNVPGLQPLRKDLLMAARGFYEEFVKERGQDPTVRADLGMAYLNLGRITAETGSRQESVRLYLKACPIFEALARERPGSPQAPYQLAVANASMGRLYLEMGRIKEADEAYRDALERASKLSKAHPESIEYRRLEGSIQSDSHRVYRDLEQPDQLEAALLRALEVRTTLVQESPKNSVDRANLAETKGHLGDFYVRRNQIDRGIALANQAIADWESVAKEQTQDQRYMSALANNLLSLGIIYSGINRMRDAAGPLERALEIRERLARENPSVVKYRHDLAVNLGYLANAYGAIGERNRAFDTFRRAQAVWEALVRELPESADMRHGLGFTLYAHGSHQLEGGHPQEAEALLVKALEIFEGLARENPQRPRFQEAIVSVEMPLARHYNSSGQLEKAKQTYRGALRRIEPILRANAKNPMMQNLRVDCALGLARLGDHAAASAEAEAAQALVEPSGLNLYNLACTLSLARAAAVADSALDRAKRERVAESYGLRAVELLKKTFAAGYFDDPASAANLRTDPDLEAIRPLSGFRALDAQVLGVRHDPKR